jgi:hypothetical protein
MLMSNFKVLGTVSHRVFKCSTKGFVHFCMCCCLEKYMGKFDWSFVV